MTRRGDDRRGWQQLPGNNCVATFAWKLRGNICVATIAWQHLARLGNICGQHLRGNICVATFAWQHLRGNATTTRRRSQNLFPKNHSSNPHSDSHPDPQKKIEVRHFLIQNVGGSVTVSEHVGGQKNQSSLSSVRRISPLKIQLAKRLN